MEILDLVGEVAFAPGELAIYATIATIIGLATGQFSRIWLAVLLALGADMAWPWILQASNGVDMAEARNAAMAHLQRDGGAAIALRMVLYFAGISMILAFKRMLGSES
jgi:hypothetical protein